MCVSTSFRVNLRAEQIHTTKYRIVHSHYSREKRENVYSE